MIVFVEPAAVAAVSGARSQEPESPELALSIEIAGVAGNAYAYAVTLVPVDSAGPEDAIEYHSGLPVLIPADSIDRLDGATIRAVTGGLEIDNPNTPSPAMHGSAAEPDLSLSVLDRVTRAIADQINPAIASHGGRVELLEVTDHSVAVKLFGGCQGCSLAGVTVSEGIELLIKKAAPEIETVRDMTDHASGTDPFFS